MRNETSIAAGTQEGIAVADRKSPLSPAGWFALLVLLAFLIVALWYAMKAWTSMRGCT
jgi:hypothetical protein